MANRIQYRRDTAANWTAANPVLALGEPAWETDTKKRKIGDGATAWNSLGYQAPDEKTLKTTYAPRSPIGSRRAIPAANTVDVLMATPPTIGAAATASSISGAAFFPSVSGSGTATQVLTDRFTYTGAGSFAAAGTAYPNNNWVVPSSLTTTNTIAPYNVSFLFDGAALEFFLSGNGGLVRVRVDGQLVTSAATTLPNDGNLYYLPITFSARAVRRITLETSNVKFGGVRVGGTDSVNPVPIRGPRAIVVGDSFTEGTGSTYSAIGSWSQKLGLSLGWDDVWASGVGGTGYLNPGSGGRVKFRDRLVNDVTSQNPQIVIWAGGINDQATYTAAQIQAEATACYQAVQAALPGVPQIVFSPWWRNGVETFPNSLLQARDAIKAAVAATNTTAQPVLFVDVLELPVGSVAPATTLSASVAAAATSLSVAGFIPQGATIDIKDGTNWERKVVTAVSGTGPYTLTVKAMTNAFASGVAVKQVGPCWWTGTGKVGATTGIGNSDLLVSSDGTHPSAAGHDELGRFAAGLISQNLMDA
jgi:lysophospholipase L1-like esterase